MRVAVIGAGIIGSSAGLELARDGHAVTIYERFAVDHDLGSSFGDSRIIRRFYDDPYYTALMPDAFALWRRLESLTGRALIENFGGLYFGPADHPSLAAAVAGMTRGGSGPPPVLDAVALRARFPAFRFHHDEAGVIDDVAGSLRASRCVRASVDAAVSSGATIVTGARVDAVEPGSEGIDVTVGGAAVRFDRVVVCAGPWSRELLAPADLPMRVTRQQYVHLVPPAADRALFEAGAMPIWIDAAASWYGFPRHGDVPGVKIASHVFGETVDPDRVDRSPHPALIERTRAYARERLPALADGDVAYEKTCLYSVTPDEDFIVDELPGVSGCSFVAGCSGHAFKFAPLLGAIAADIALGRAPRADISRFRLARWRDGSSNA